MKALSIRQPWAWLIANGYKDIENRDWPTKYRGTFLIHASQKIDKPAMQYIADWMPREFIHLAAAELKFGGIIGTADIVGCVNKSDSPWFFGKYGFVLRGAKPVDFVPLKGALGFFNVPDELLPLLAQ